jgi:hypothetical protein
LTTNGNKNEDRGPGAEDGGPGRVSFGPYKESQMYKSLLID